MHNAALDDDAADELLVAAELVDQVLPPAASSRVMNAIRSYNNSYNARVKLWARSARYGNFSKFLKLFLEVCCTSVMEMPFAFTIVTFWRFSVKKIIL